MMPTNTNTNTGGTRMAYIRASRSQAICIKTATIKPAFKNHKQEDEKPSEVSMETEVVDEIRASAQDKQPSPDHEIKLNRVLLPFDVCDCLCHGHLTKDRKGQR